MHTCICTIHVKHAVYLSLLSFIITETRIAYHFDKTANSLIYNLCHFSFKFTTTKLQ